MTRLAWLALGFVAGVTASAIAVLTIALNAGGDPPGRYGVDASEWAAAEFGVRRADVLPVPPRSQAEVAADRQLLLERIRREGMGG